MKYLNHDAQLCGNNPSTLARSASEGALPRSRFGLVWCRIAHGYLPLLMALAVVLTSAESLRAQRGPPPHAKAWGYANGRGYGLGVHYHSGRLSISGYVNRGFFGGYAIDPYFGYQYGPPSRVVERRIYQEVVTPPRVIVVPAEPEYDVTGVDLDLVHPPVKMGPNGPIDDDEKPAAKLPGKDVSVPKKPLRPGQPPPPPQPPPVKPKAPQPAKPAVRPQPPPALPNPKDEADRQIVQGVTAFKNQQYGLAAQRFQRAVEQDQTNSLGWFLRSQAEFALGFYDEATKSIQEGMKRRFDWPQAKFRPRLQLYKGNEADFDQHLKRLDDIVKQQPNAAAFLFLAAHQRWFDGRRAEAIPLFRNARKVAQDVIYIDRFLNAGQGKVVVAN